MNERIIAFIVARLSSSRLPQKQLRKIGDKRLIDWTIENIKRSDFVEKIVIATTDDEENRPLIDVANEHGIDVFLYKGDINDVVGRLTKAAGEYDADIPILISGDCPLIWAESLDRLIKRILEDEEIDRVVFCELDGRVPIHEGMGVYRRKCWELANRLSDRPNLREHHLPILGLKPDLFKIECVVDDELFYKIKHRVSVDTPADLDFMNAVYSELKSRDREFNLKNVIELLLEKPEFMEINRDVHQIELEEMPKKALFVVKDRDNIDLFFDIAYQLTKRGIGVRFYSEDKDILADVVERGFGVADSIESNRFDLQIVG